MKILLMKFAKVLVFLYLISVQIAECTQLPRRDLRDVEQIALQSDPSATLSLKFKSRRKSVVSPQLLDRTTELTSDRVRMYGPKVLPQADQETLQRHSQKSKCPLSKDFDEPHPVEGLTRCPEYEKNACCSSREHTKLDNDFKAAYESIYGACPGCLENMRVLLCGIHCSPDQHSFIELEVAVNRTISENDWDGLRPRQRVPNLKATARLCPVYCDRWYTSCLHTVPASFFPDNIPSFCISQMDTAQGIRLELNAYDCFGKTSPNVCNGPNIYMHDTVGPNVRKMHDTLLKALWISGIVVTVMGTTLCIVIWQMNSKKEKSVDEKNIAMNL